MTTFQVELRKIIDTLSAPSLYKNISANLRCVGSLYSLRISILAFFVVVGLQSAKAQVYLMNGSNTLQTFNTCSGTFYDSGGASGNYGNYEDYTITFCSSNSDPIVISFTSLNLESGWDYLYVYDGPSDASPQMTGSPLTGTGAPTFTSTGTCITFVFQSDGSGSYSGWAANISCGQPAGGGDINNPGGNINTCSGTFNDSGGPAGNYGPNQNIITTICADEVDQCLSMAFSSFNIESGWDYLDIYDGSSTGAPLIGSYTGTLGPGQITATGSCLTFHFTSDGSYQYSGWGAAISCSDCDTGPPIGGEPPGCPSIDITEDLDLDCTEPCVDLTAEVTETGLTTSYEVSPIAYDPPYPFTGGTPLFIGTDDIWGPMVNLPFNFCFYGNMYSQITVGANGVVSFNPAYANAFCPWSFNATIPSNVLPQNAIFGAYHDMNPAVYGDINYAILGSAPCRTFVVNFNGVAHFSCTSISTTQQIVIYETTNIIDVYVLDKPTCYSWNSGNAVIGIQNAGGTVGLTPPGRNTGSWSASNEAWRFTPNGPPNYVINWYDDSNSLIGTGNSVQVCPSEDATYTGEVIYQHCDGSQVIETDQVTITVAESFTLEATPVPVSCPGACDGSVSVAVTDGQAPFTYDIGNGAQNNGSFTGLCAGSHEVEVTDDNGCIVIVPFDIEEPGALDPGLDNSIEVCESDAAFNLFDQLNGTPETGGQWYDPSNSPTSGIFDPASSSAGTYTYELGDPSCIYSAEVTVAINPILTSTQDFTICEDENVTLPDGSIVNTTGSYDVTLSSAVTGCDSTITTNVIVNPLLTSTQEVAICDGEQATLPDGTQVNTAGSYDVTLSSVVTGCDSTVTTNVTVNPLLTSTQDIAICDGEQATLPDGTQVSAAGSYDVTLSSVVTGCDSTVTTNVIVNPLLTSSQDITICEDEQVTLPDGTQVNTAGSYDVTLSSVVTGCDSTITTNVTVNPLLTSTQDITICEDEQVTLPDGTQVNTAGSYDVTLSSVVTGCDSTITTNVTVNPLLTSTQNITICEDEQATLPDGTQVNTTGSYDVTLSSVVTGCDSTITTNVTVNPLLTSTQDFIICEDEQVTLPDGTQVNTAGSYDVTLSSVVTGCDSTITTNVTVNPLLTSTQDITICEDEQATLPDGTQVNTAGSYDVTLSSVVTGCDSTITTNVTVNPLLTSTQDITICEDEEVTLPDGTHVNTAGSYDVTLSSVVTGCDSTITTNVTVNPLLTSTQDITICEDEQVTLPDGTQVNTAGSYDVTLSSVITGCDSTITTNVTVNPLLTSTQNITICEDEQVTLPDGSQVNTAGSYDVTLSSVVTGCDSTITTNVTVTPLLTSTQNITICEDEQATLPDGTQVNTAGSYDVTLSSAVTGCDSTITTNVTVNPLLTSTQNITICEDEQASLPDGTQVSTAGSYDVTLSSVITGCDSTITTNVTVNPLLTSTQNITICEDEQVTLPDGSQVNTAGSYDVTLSSVVTGCDSTITTNVTVNPLLTSTQDFTICEDEQVTLPDGTQVNTAGSYDVVLSSVITGCDSTVTTNVTVNPILAATQDITICEDEQIILMDGTPVYVAGTYDVVLSSEVTGCDSVITATVTINPLLTTTTEVAICEGEEVTLPDGTAVSETGSYDVVLSSVVTGCDSTVTTNVTVNPLLTSTQDLTICEDEQVTLPDGTQVNTAGSYDVTLSSVVTGCDSTVTTNVTVNPLLTSTQDFTICEDEQVTLPDGTQVNTEGSYDVTLSSVVTGCDSTITTNVTVNPLLTSTQDFTICEDDEVTLPDGTQVNTAGSYDVTLSSVVTGCDSTITTNVSVNPLLTSTQDITICEDEQVTLPDGTQVNTAGSYDVTLSSVVTGCDSTITTNVSVVGLIATANLTEECAPSGSTYTISFEISGGDPGSYNVSGVTGTLTGSNPAVFTSDAIAEGTTYNISVEDGNACNTINLTGTVSCSCLATAELSGGATICEGGSGDITFNFDGNGPYTVTYSDGSNNYTLNDVADGHTLSVSPTSTTTYTLVSMSDQFCAGNTSGSATITVNTIPTAGTNGTLTLCENDASVNLFGELGGTPDSGGDWTAPDGSAFTNPFDPQTDAAGVYTYTVYGTTPCPDASATVSVEILDEITVSEVSEDCQANGAAYTVSFEISGGDPSSYSVTGIAGTLAPGNPATFTSDPIASGDSYAITVEDGNACNSIELSGLVVCDCPVTAAISGGAVICLGGSADIEFTLAGGGPFDVVYSDGNDDFALNGISDGHTVSVSPIESTTYTLVSVSNSICPGTVSGSAVITVDSPVDAGLDGSLTVCANAEAQDLFDLLGGSPEGNGSWTSPDGNAFDGQFNPATEQPGTYTYTVLGGVCPDDFAEVDVVINPLPHAEILGDASICDGNLANLQLELSGSAPWTVVYAIDGIAQPAITTSDSDYTIETGQEGIYTLVSVSDANCTGTTSGNGTVAINDTPTATISGQEEICPGSETGLNITLTGESPWTLIYSIDGTVVDTLEINTANYTLTTDAEGVYEIVQLNDANCPGTFSGSAEVTFLPGPEAVISGGGTICYGDSALVQIELDGTGNIDFVYSFNGVNHSASSTAGTYSFYADESGDFELISVEDDNCTGLISGSAEVVVNSLPTATLLDGSAICEGDTASLQIVFTGQAPFSINYTLNGVAQTAQSTSDTLTLYTQTAGVYELQAVTDDNCSNGAGGLAEIVVHELPSGTMTGGGEICAGENEEIVIEFTGSGNWEFVVSIDDVLQEPVNTDLTPYFIYTDETSTYDLVAVSDDFCVGDAQGQAEVDVAPLPTATLTGNSSICDGQAATLVFELTGSGPWTIGYAIDGVQQPPLQANSSPFELSTSTIGDYTLLSVADANCIGTTSGSGTVQENPMPTAQISGNAFLCPSDSTSFTIELSGTAPYTLIYSIDGVEQPPVVIQSDSYQLTAQQAGTYIIESVSDINCTNFGTGSAVLEHAPTPTATLTGGGTFCPGEMGNVAILFTGEGPWTFEYAINGEVFGPTTTPSNSYTLFDDITGTYTLVSVSDMNCSGSFSGEAYVEFGGSPEVEISPGGKVCPGDFVELWAEGSGGAPPYSYQWFNTNDDSWVQFDDTVSVLGNTPSGIYVVVTDQCGGTVHSDTSWVEPELVPLSSFNYSPRHGVTVQYTTIEFNSETSLFAYGLTWKFFELTEYYGWQQIGTSYGPNPTFTFPEEKPGQYQACLYVQTEAGCVDELCLPIEILDDFVFYMPNAFTPNEDGLNDLYGPVMQNVDPSGFEFLIVNRWGETVFYTNDIDQKWDGSGMKGEYYAPDGIYSWKVRVRQLNAADAVEFKGHVNLLR